ncbi:MAG: hypothetical protein R3E89_14830 [Thiolinea sp.]
MHHSLLLLDLKIVNKSLYDTGLVKILRAWEQHNGQRAIPVIAMAAYIPCRSAGIPAGQRH